MKIRLLKDVREITAGDGVLLRELCNPNTQPDFTGRYSLAVARLSPGKSSKPHRLATHELYFILSGVGVMHIEEESEEVNPGCAIEIPSGSRQWLENIGAESLTFLCIVDPGWSLEDEAVL
jgi:mannose-6-phosphate isomerase-like protein (cupin superfamily)